MKIDISDKEKLALVSCLNSRLSELLDDDSFKALYELDYADWAENFKKPLATKTADRIDTINKLLLKLGSKRNPIIFNDIIDKIKDLKKCSKCLLTGRSDDYYRISFISGDFKVVTFDLKTSVRLRGEFSLLWIQRSKEWVETESRKTLTTLLSKKETWLAIKNCKYVSSRPDDKMMRFLKVILR
jgi:hypothetical protein